MSVFVRVDPVDDARFLIVWICLQIHFRIHVLTCIDVSVSSNFHRHWFQRHLNTFLVFMVVFVSVADVGQLHVHVPANFI